MVFHIQKISIKLGIHGIIIIINNSKYKWFFEINSYLS